MAKYCESVQNTPNCGPKSEIEKSPTIFTCKYALKPYFLPLQEKDKSLNSFEIQGLALFYLFLKWYHQELYFIYKWLYIITFQKRKKGNLLLLLHLEFALFCASLHGGFLLQR